MECPKCENWYLLEEDHCWKCGYVPTRPPTKEEMEETTGDFIDYDDAVQEEKLYNPVYRRKIEHKNLSFVAVKTPRKKGGRSDKRRLQ